MFCTNCGKQIADNNKFCPKCGAKVELTDLEPGKKAVERVEDNNRSIQLESTLDLTNRFDQTKKKRGRKGRSVFGLALFVIIGIVGFAVFRGKTVELSEFLDQPITLWEENLNSELNTVESGVYYLEKGNTNYFECVVDESSNVIIVTLLNAEKGKYSLWGVENGMSAQEAEEHLLEAGLTHIRNQLWQCPNGMDAFYLTSEGYWVFEKNSEYLEEELLRIKAEEAFSYRFPESIGAVYLGKGRILEYCHSSFAEFVHQYGETTGYSQEELIKKYDMQYILVAGEVFNVSSDGIISVGCVDEEATIAAGLIWPITGTAEIELVYEQQKELSNIKKGDQIVAYGKIDMYSASYSYGLESFHLNLGILTSINNRSIDVPELQNCPMGITVYGEAEQVYEKTPESSQEYSAADLIGLSMNQISQIYGNQYSTYYPDGDPPYIYYETGCPYLFFPDNLDDENSIITEIRGSVGAEIADGVCIGDSLDDLNLVFGDRPNYCYDETVSNYGYFQNVSFDLEFCSIYIDLEDSIITGFQCFWE